MVENISTKTYPNLDKKLSNCTLKKTSHRILWTIIFHQWNCTNNWTKIHIRLVNIQLFPRKLTITHFGRFIRISEDGNLLVAWWFPVLQNKSKKINYDDIESSAGAYKYRNVPFFYQWQVGPLNIFANSYKESGETDRKKVQKKTNYQSVAKAGFNTFCINIFMSTKLLLLWVAWSIEYTNIGSLSAFSINLLAYYHECRALIGYATHYLFNK